MAQWTLVRDDQRISAAGEFRTRDANAIWRVLLDATRAPGSRLDIDLTDATVIDGTVMALLVEIRRSLIARSTTCEIVGARPEVSPIVRMYRGHEPPVLVRTTPPRRVGFVRRLGAFVDRAMRSTLAPAEFFGEMLEGVGQTMRRPGPTS